MRTVSHLFGKWDAPLAGLVFRGRRRFTGAAVAPGEGLIPEINPAAAAVT